MYLICLLVKRFLQAAYHEKSLSLMLKICFISIIVGSFALALVAAIMQGFEKVTRHQLQGINADVYIRSYDAPLSYEKLRTALLTDYPAYISEVTPYYYGHGLLAIEQENDISPVFMVVGINPSTEKKVSSLVRFVKEKYEPTAPFEDLFNNAGIIVGESAAHHYNLKIGDSIDLLYVPHASEYRKTISLEKVSVHITGIFNSGVDEFDTQVIVMSEGLFHQIFPQRGTYQVGFKLEKSSLEKEIIHLLKKRLELPVFSWKELYPAILSALTLEKYAMILILMLITLLASMNIIALLFMFITHKRKDLIVFKAMGMNNGTIRQAFIMVGMLVTMGAAALGVGGAGLVSWLLETYKLIQLPEVYYVTYLPAHFTIFTALFVMFLALIMSFGASWFSTRSLTRYSISTVLKSE